jgi:3-oxoacyl-[acyl-carrier protein] reductase
MARVVLVSGATGALGQAIVSHLLEQGDSVCALSRRRNAFVTALEQAPAVRERFLFAPVDLAQRVEVARFVRSAVERFARIDVLINNAAVVHAELLALSSLDGLDETIDANLRGALHLIRACLRPMLVARHGRIVTISSVAGLRGYAGLVAYSATKAALDGMTRALAREVSPRGITANCIAPGYLDLGMSHALSERQRLQIVRRTPVGRLGTAADILPVLDFLLSPGAGFITGQVLVVDGGLTS